jgi:hypothetical protein
MALGLAILLVAMIDDLALALLGGTPSYDAAAKAKAAETPHFER